MTRDAQVYEVGPPDGLQSARNRSGKPIVISTDEKVQYVDLLSDSGLPFIEIGSFVSYGIVPLMADSIEVAIRIQRRFGVEYSALVPTRRFYDLFRSARLPECAVFISANEAHNRANLNCSISDMRELVLPVIQISNDEGKRVRAYVSAVFGYQNSKDTSVDTVIDLVKELRKKGVYQVSLGDTTAMANSLTLQTTLQTLLDADIPPSFLALHLHHKKGDDPRSLIDVGLEMGIRTFDSATGGIGGCPTNPNLQNVDTLSLVQHLENSGLRTGVDIEKIVEAQRHIVEALHLDAC